MAKSKFYQDEPRQIGTIDFECHAKPELFLAWDDMSKAAQKEFTKNGPIPCEGGGVPGEWCATCRFGRVKRDAD